MKSIALLALTTMMSCSLALAQPAAGAAKPAAAQAAKPAGEAAKPAAAAAPTAAQAAAKPVTGKSAQASKKPATTGVKRARRDEDARHCLGRSSTTEIIKCAEAYL